MACLEGFIVRFPLVAMYVCAVEPGYGQMHKENKVIQKERMFFRLVTVGYFHSNIFDNAGMSTPRRHAVFADRQSTPRLLQLVLKMTRRERLRKNARFLKFRHNAGNRRGPMEIWVIIWAYILTSIWMRPVFLTAKSGITSINPSPVTAAIAPPMRLSRKGCAAN